MNKSEFIENILSFVKDKLENDISENAEGFSISSKDNASGTIEYSYWDKLNKKEDSGTIILNIYN